MHRDIKPSNILLPEPDPFTTGGPRAKLADFGIARIVGGTRLTATGMILGTAGYFSPEQALGEAITPASDVYSLGLVLLECLTGERSFPGSAAESMAARISAEPLIPADLDHLWGGLLGRMTSRDPSARPSARRIEAVLTGVDEDTADENEPTLVYPVMDASARPETSVATRPATGLRRAGDYRARPRESTYPDPRPVTGGRTRSVTRAPWRGVRPAADRCSCCSVLPCSRRSTRRPPSAVAEERGTVTHRAGPVLAASLTMALALGGCAPTPAEYDTGAAERLQTKVVAVTASSAAADYASAMVALDELVAQAKDALARHQISSPRYESIMAAVRLVQADLEAAIASLQPAPAEAPADGANQGTGHAGLRRHTGHRHRQFR